MAPLILTDFYNPKVITFSKILIDLNLFFQLFMLPFVIYALLKKSPHMKVYRLYLLNGILWNTLSEILFFFCSPIFLGVYTIVIINSPFEYWLDNNGWITVFEVVFIAGVGIIVGFSVSAMYRIIHLLNLAKYVKFIDQKRVVIACLAIGYMFIVAAVVYVFEWRRSSSLSLTNYESILAEATVLIELLNSRRFICKCLKF